MEQTNNYDLSSLNLQSEIKIPSMLIANKLESDSNINYQYQTEYQHNNNLSNQTL